MKDNHTKEDVAIQIAEKIIAIPDNKPEHAADHKLRATIEIIKNCMRMAERHSNSALLEQNRELREALKNSNQRISELLRFDAAKWSTSFKLINAHVNDDPLVKSNKALLTKYPEI